MKEKYTVTGQTALGCSFVVTAHNPVVVKTEPSSVKAFSKKVADRIKGQLESEGDKIFVQPLTSE